MIRIRTYLPEDKPFLESIFKSNIPLYFDPTELDPFLVFLDEKQFPYYVILEDEVIVGCAGIAIKGDNPEVVTMCWGMVDVSRHRKGYGEALLKHRIRESHRLFPGKKIVLGTSQHSYPFFEKYGFKVVYTEKDHWAPGFDLYQMELSD